MAEILQKLANEALGWVLIGALTVPERRAEVLAWADEWLTALEQEQWPPQLETLSMWGLSSEEEYKANLMNLAREGDEEAALVWILAQSCQQLRRNNDPYAFIRRLEPLSYLESEENSHLAIKTMVGELDYELAVRQLLPEHSYYLEPNTVLEPVSAEEFKPQLLELIQQHLHQLPAPFNAIPHNSPKPDG